MDYDQYAELYEKEYSDYRIDIPFYLKKALQAGSPVLELGCGTGRVLLELAKAGLEVWGVDISQPMLDIAHSRLQSLPSSQAQNVHLILSDMTDFALPIRFKLIYLPFREFMHLETVSEQLKALRCMARHLDPDGTILLNQYDLDLEVLINGAADRDPVLYRQPHSDFIDPDTGQRVMVSTASKFDPRVQLLQEERFYDFLNEQGIVTKRQSITLRQCWIFKREMEHLLARAGLRAQKIYGDYAGKAYSTTGQDMTWEIRMATPSELEQDISHLQEIISLQN